MRLGDGLRNRFGVGVAVVCLSLTFVGAQCKKKTGDASDGGDAATDALAAAPVDSGPAAPEATNVSDIARFGDETKIDHEVLKTEAPLSIARKSPPNGDIVARLPRGTEVTKLASHETQFLVTFANPKKADERLMGWIGATAFKAAPAALQACKTDKDCGAKGVCIPHETGTKCEKACSPTNTAACPAHFECKGEGPNAEGKVVQYCVSTLPADAGAAPVAATDAGGAPNPAPTPRDGGKGSSGG
jgi:hypothetical protein